MTAINFFYKPMIGISVLASCLLLGSAPVLADSPITIKHTPVDHATLHAKKIDRNAPLHVHLFEADTANLGKAKHQDTALLMAHTVPHLLAVDVVESLRDGGFSNIILQQSNVGENKLKAGELALVGRFSELNPGSQAVRAWIGFGAGKSKVCIKGRIVDSKDISIGEFSHCRSGIGWGNSAGELEQETHSIGDNIAKLLVEWASGKFAGM